MLGRAARPRRACMAVAPRAESAPSNVSTHGTTSTSARRGPVRWHHLDQRQLAGVCALRWLFSVLVPPRTGNGGTRPAMMVGCGSPLPCMDVLPLCFYPTIKRGGGSATPPFPAGLGEVGPPGAGVVRRSLYASQQFSRLRDWAVGKGERGSSRLLVSSSNHPPRCARCSDACTILRPPAQPREHTHTHSGWRTPFDAFGCVIIADNCALGVFPRSHLTINNPFLRATTAPPATAIPACSPHSPRVVDSDPSGRP